MSGSQAPCLDNAVETIYTIAMGTAQEGISEISARRQAAGLTIYKLAKLAGVKWETLRDLEQGRRGPPRQRTLRRLEAVLREHGV